LSYGSFGTNQERLWLGNSLKHFDYMVELNRYASKGFKELDNGGNTGFDRRDIMAKMRWHTSDNAPVPQSLTLKLLKTTEKGNESYLGLTFEDFKANPLRRYAATQKDLLDLSHSHISLSHVIKPFAGFSINTVTYYSDTYRDWSRVNTIGGQSINNILADPVGKATAYQIMIGKADGSIDYQSAARTYFSKGIQSNAQYTFGHSNVFHKIQLGVRYHADRADRYATKSVYTMKEGSMVLNNAGMKGNQENQIRNALSLATYINYDITIKKLTLSPGFRFENIDFEFENFGNNDLGRLGTALKTASNELKVLLPGIGINYQISKSMSTFGGIHKGFSPPGMPSVTTTTDQAKVETANNYELGYRLEKDRLNLQMVGFLNKYQNILGSDNVSGGGAGTGDMFNAGNAKIQGLEAKITYDLLSNKNRKLKVPVTIAYTYTKATFEDTFINAGGDWGTGQINKGDYIPFITPQMFSSSIGIENQKFNAGFIARYLGQTRTKPGQAKVTVPADNIKYNDVNTIDAFMIVDFSANYKFSKNIAAFTTINNLFNNQSIIANLPNGYRPNMPFSLVLGLKSNF
jgi:Fe(3+) dicitrate transport protein